MGAECWVKVEGVYWARARVREGDVWDEGAPERRQDSNIWTEVET